MRQRGFTLIELLTVITIAAIMIGIAVPSFKNFIAAQRVKSTSYDLYATLLIARSEAIKRNRDVTIQPGAADAWAAGWTVTTVQKVAGADTTVTLHNQPAMEGISISKAPSNVVFTATGRPSGGSGNWEVAGSDGKSRCVKLDTSGTSSTFTVACP